MKLYNKVIENLCLKGALGVCSVLPQALQGGIIHVLKTHFLVLNKNFRFCQTNNFSEVIKFRVYLPFWLHYSIVKVFHFKDNSGNYFKSLTF